MLRHAQFCERGAALEARQKGWLAALTSCPDAALSGCGKIVGRYRMVETLGEQSYAIGFRNDDYVRYYVEAALQELAADGTISGLANTWFIEDNTSFAARAGRARPVRRHPAPHPARRLRPGRLSAELSGERAITPASTWSSRAPSARGWAGRRSSSP